MNKIEYWRFLQKLNNITIEKYPLKKLRQILTCFLSFLRYQIF